MTLADEIRAAIAAGDFARARRGFEAYALLVTTSIRDGCCTAETIREAGDLVGWSRQMTLSARSHLEAELGEMKAREYLAALYKSGN